MISRAYPINQAMLCQLGLVKAEEMRNVRSEASRLGNVALEKMGELSRDWSLSCGELSACYKQEPALLDRSWSTVDEVATSQ